MVQVKCIMYKKKKGRVCGLSKGLEDKKLPLSSVFLFFFFFEIFSFLVQKISLTTILFLFSSLVMLAFNWIVD